MNIQAHLEKAIFKYHKSPYHVETLLGKKHLDIYMNTDYVVSNPQLLGCIIVEYLIPHFQNKNINPDWIVSYPPFGLPVAYEIAKQIGAKFAYIDTDKCNFPIEKGSNVFVVGDDLYSGSSIVNTIQVLEKENLNVYDSIFVIANFSGTGQIGPHQIVSCVSQKTHSYDADNCPMCQNGSIPVSPRSDRNKLVG